MRAFICVVCVAVVAGSIAGAVVHLRAPTAVPGAPSAATAALVSTRYTLVTSVDRIPRGVLSDMLARMPHDPRLANPEDWLNKTDVVDARYPVRRLVLAGINGESAFVIYEHGGRGYHRHLVIYAQPDGQPQLAYAGAFVSEAATIEQVRMLVHSGLVIETEEF